jgi:Na+-transporting methylmalonyl-CoA/oxaloacetate decarboxylase beta subunit
MTTSTRINQLDDNYRKEELKITKTMLMVVASFVICWIPMSSHLLGEAITGDWIFSREIVQDLFNCDEEKSMVIAAIIRSFSIQFTLFNSLADPIICITRMTKLRNEVIKFLLCR